MNRARKVSCDSVSQAIRFFLVRSAVFGSYVLVGLLTCRTAFAAAQPSRDIVTVEKLLNFSKPLPRSSGELLIWRLADGEEIFRKGLTKQTASIRYDTVDNLILWADTDGSELLGIKDPASSALTC
jgi:hypothetical protein